MSTLEEVIASVQDAASKIAAGRKFAYVQIRRPELDALLKAAQTTLPDSTVASEARADSEAEYCKQWLIQMAKNYGASGTREGITLREAVQVVESVLSSQWEELTFHRNARGCLQAWLGDKRPG